MSARDELNKAVAKIQEMEKRLADIDAEADSIKDEIAKEESRLAVAAAIAREDDINMDAMFCVIETLMQSLAETATDPNNPHDGGISTDLFTSTLEQVKSITGRDIRLGDGSTDDTGPPSAVPEGPQVTVVAS